MPAEWPTVRLEEIASTDRKGFAMGPFGSNIRSENYQQAGVPVLRGVNLGEAGFIHDDLVFLSEQKAEELKNSQAFPGDVIFVAQGTVGKVGLVPNHPRFQKTVLSQNLMKFSCDRSKCDPRFFYYFFVSAEGQHTIRSRVNPTGVPCISRPLSSLKEFEVPFPPLVEQKAIAAVLGALDDKIELNRRMNATLEAMARALFQSWFVDFDPVRAKLDGRQPAALDQATAVLFPLHFEHTENGMLPTGWRHAAIEEVCEANSWTLGKHDDLRTLEYVEISEVTRGDIANIATYARGEEPSRARRRLRNGDTVLSTVRPDRGSYFLALNPPKNRVASTGFAVLTPTKAPWSFVHAAMTQPEVFDYLGQMADGGAYPAVRPDVITAWKVVVPNDQKLLDAFHQICAPLFEQANVNRIESRTLTSLRDTLVPKLLSGQLIVVGVV